MGTQGLPTTRTALATVLLSLACAQTAPAQCHYDVQVIRHMCGPTTTSPTRATALNEHNVVVGYVQYCVAGYERPFIWTAEEGLQLIPLPPGAFRASAFDVNGKGEIVGAIDVSAPTQGFFLGAAGMVLLPPTEPGGLSEAVAINDDSVVLGTRSVGGSIEAPENAFFWSAFAGFEDLGFLTGPETHGTFIANDGTMLGYLGTSEANGQGLIWRRKEIVNMGTIPGGWSSIPRAMNADGAVVGYGRLPLKGAPPAAPRAFLWRDGAYTMLGTLPGLLFSGAVNINSFGLTIGRSWYGETNPNASRAFIWHDAHLIDLNDLVDLGSGGDITHAYGLNDGGSIAASGHLNGATVSFLLTPRDRPVADVDADCDVDRADLEFVLRDWGTNQIGSDVNGDGIVDALDFLAVLAGWTID